MASNSNRDKDQSLLDRLNALKGTNLNLDLDTSKNSLGTPISPFAPPGKQARDDALSARLRSLRDKSQDTPPPAGSSASPSTAAGVSTIPPPTADDSTRASVPAAAVAQPPSKVSTSHRTGVAASGPFSTFSPPEVEEDDDPLFASDAKDLDDLLEGLEDLGLPEEEAAGAAEQTEKEPQGASGPPNLDAQLTEAQRTATLFAKFEKQVSKRLDRAGLGVAAADILDGEDGDDKNDDDSDGEEIRREADDALLRALDELSLETTRLPAASADAKPSSGLGAGDPEGGSKPGAGEGEDEDFSLPTPPSTLPPAFEEEDGTEKGRRRRRGSADFEADFSSRLARLRGERGAAVAADELGLPSVPSYKPGDVDKTTRLTTRTGYTDDDVKNWCILCLEDATCRCEGCDDDVYCERCWWGMHVGPSADYDARGHRRWKFTKK
ncbi:hypothetical protein MAPG_07577 [Magnaporthiopsis poae ATCC 64411]|uniref:Zinc finger FYVE domain-containing protein n=1 Tax=Magnaporthiopsis poae (strain ATCC 64411 / 73-15) TaxID=644358 RepID=A0A0C4E518_MAGP6|nr:hypothetical protein MAPG_07577 [Magnaporthiopsis poae ATCC 64411]